MIFKKLNESFIEADEFNGSDDEFQRLCRRIEDRLSDYKNKYGDIELTLYDLPEIEFDEMYLYPDEYTYDFNGDDFGSNLLYDLAEFLDIPVNEVTDEDIDDFDSIKFYKFLCDKYYDDIVAICEKDTDFLYDLWKDEDEKLYWENNEPDWDDRY